MPFGGWGHKMLNMGEVVVTGLRSAARLATVVAVAATLAFAWATPAAAQFDLGDGGGAVEGGGAPTIDWTLTLDPAAAAPGAVVMVTATAEIPDGYHIYTMDEDEWGVPTSITVADAPEWLSIGGDWMEPGTTDAGEYEYFEGTAAFTIFAMIAETAPPGDHDLTLNASYQPCDDAMCYMVTTTPMTATLTIVSGADEPGPATEGEPGPPQTQPGDLDTTRPEPQVFGGDDDRVRWRVAVDPPYAKPGQTVTMTFTALIKPGFHIYSIADETTFPTLFDFSSVPDVLTATGELKDAKHKAVGPNLWVSSGGVFAQDFVVADDAAPQRLTVPATVDWMACDELRCYLPKSAEVDATLVILAPDAEIPATPEPGAGEPGEQPDDAPDGQPDVEQPELPTLVAVWDPAFEARAAGPGDTVVLKAERVPLDPALGDHLAEAPDDTVPDIDVEPAWLIADGEWELTDGTWRRAYRIAEAGAPTGDQTVALLIGNGHVTTVAAPALTVTGPGILWLILTAIGAALVSLLTPCVFPMIPVTISHFVNLADQAKRSALAAAGIENPDDAPPEALRAANSAAWNRQVSVALVYGAGILGTFTLVAGVLTLVLGGFNIAALMQNPWPWAIMAAVVLLFALSFLGLFELRLPSSWTSKLQTGAGGGAMAGTLVMGIGFTLASFACTGPIVGTLIAVGVTDGEVLKMFIGVVTYGIAFAVPFVVLGLAPGLLTKMPRSGVWMVKVKVVMAFVMLLFVVVLLDKADPLLGNFMTRGLMLSLMAAVLAVFAIYLLGLIRFKLEAPYSQSGPVSTVTAVILLGLAAWFSSAAGSGAPVGIVEEYLPAVEPQLQGGGGAPAGAATDPHPWTTDYEAAAAAAKAGDVPLLLDFTGHFCANCKANEKSIWPDAGVKDRFRKFVKVKLYSETGEHEPSPQNVDTNMEVYGEYAVIAQPTYIVVNPADGTALARLEGKTTVEAFTRFLDQGLARFNR
jgi:thiol:disulfide interchange protein